MATFKCKMCGGALEVNENQTVCECEYCGSQQTLPRLSDDRKANLYDRANHFRRNNDFDKAMGIYEQILNEDNTDAEAYWSLVLCQYGIEYVEDPASHKRIPTVNRAQYTSIFDDDNYKSALANADTLQKTVYEEEARTINEIQKGILEISQKEEPFDVFICYKETDNNGRRTQDSVLANDLYHQLTQEGLKVFFARITLEDKLGSAYEPYIFAALNSAKVMVVLGTKPEYFNAVWVKNEWSRYLALVKQSAGKKMLIPAYRDMDPYDLPEEFSHLQSQDMSKLGFMQDLIRGIKKILQVDMPQAVTETVRETVVMQDAGNANVEPLLKRVFMFLEDRDWNSANEYCEKVLDIDPENGEAYLGKLMADIHVAVKDNLVRQEETFSANNNYQKAYRFGDNSLKEFLDTVTNKIIYNGALLKMGTATTENEYKEAGNIFRGIIMFSDAETKSKECYKMAEIARKDAIYDEAAKLRGRRSVETYERIIKILTPIADWKDAQQIIAESEVGITSIKDATLNRGMYLQKEDTLPSLEKAVKEFFDIRGWKNADELLKETQNRIDEIKRAREKERAERERIEKIAREKAAKKRKRTRIIVVSAILAFVFIMIIEMKVIIPNNKYNNAIDMMNAGEYEKALEAFNAMNGYRDSGEMSGKCYEGITENEYEKATKLLEEGEYENAKKIYDSISWYKDSKEMLMECDYDLAIAMKNSGDYEAAIEIFDTISGYKDSEKQIELCKETMQENKYEEALSLIENGDYIEAEKIIEELVNYMDRKGLYQQISQQIVQQISQYGNVGDKVKFGNYEWQILAKENNKALLITADAVCNKQYAPFSWQVTWEKSTLRKWLNNEFYNEFGETEKNLITPTHLENNDLGNATDDKIFILSIDEVKKYFSSDSARVIGSCWWLRSLHRSENLWGDIIYSKVAVVMKNGKICSEAFYSDDESVAVRPAMWISLE